MSCRGSNKGYSPCSWINNYIFPWEPMYRSVSVLFYFILLVQFSSVQDCNDALGKAHTRSTTSVRSFPNVAFEIVPMFVWLTMALSRPFEEHPLALPLSAPLSSTCCQAVPIVSHTCRHSRARSEKVGHVYTHFCDTNSEFHIVPVETFRVSNRWVTSLALEVRQFRSCMLQAAETTAGNSACIYCIYCIYCTVPVKKWRICFAKTSPLTPRAGVC